MQLAANPLSICIGSCFQFAEFLFYLTNRITMYFCFRFVNYRLIQNLNSGVSQRSERGCLLLLYLLFDAFLISDLLDFCFFLCVRCHKLSGSPFNIMNTQTQMLDKLILNVNFHSNCSFLIVLLVLSYFSSLYFWRMYRFS